MNKNGSSIIFVVIITAIIMVILLHASTIALCSTSVAIKRQHYEQRFRSVQGLLMVVCTACKEHWQLLTQHAPYHWVTEFTAWPCAEQHADYSGLALVIIENESCMKVTASLLDEKKVKVISAHCTLEHSAPNKIKIHSWTTNDDF